MHDKSSVEFHKEVIYLRKQESKLKKLLSIPRRKLDQEELVESLRDVRGEIESPRVRVTREVLTSGHTRRGTSQMLPIAIIQLRKPPSHLTATEL